MAPKRKPPAAGSEPTRVEEEHAKPKGRPPKGKQWDAISGEWVVDPDAPAPAPAAEGITRPKGRAPKGKLWDADNGEWVDGPDVPVAPAAAQKQKRKRETPPPKADKKAETAPPPATKKAKKAPVPPLATKKAKKAPVPPPATKKAKKAPVPPPAKKKANAPPQGKLLKEQHFDRVTAKVTAIGGLGSLLVRGVSRDVDLDDDDDDGSEIDEDTLTQSELDGMRHILITQARADALEKMEKLVLGDQAGERFLSFTTSFSYRVVPLIAAAAKGTAAARWGGNSAAARFDVLFALTHAVSQHDVWAHDHEDSDEVVRAVNALGKAWRALLAQPDAALGIDSEYTRPGAVALCAELEAKIDHLEDDRGRAPAPWGLGA